MNLLSVAAGLGSILDTVSKDTEDTVSKEVKIHKIQPITVSLSYLRYVKMYLKYTLRWPLMGEVLSTRIWGVPPAGGPLL